MKKLIAGILYHLIKRSYISVIAAGLIYGTVLLIKNGMFIKVVGTATVFICCAGVIFAVFIWANDNK